MNLTPHQQSVITVALELEQMQHHFAAQSLLERHFPDIPWANPIATTHVPWPEVFRINNES